MQVQILNSYLKVQVPSFLSILCQALCASSHEYSLIIKRESKSEKRNTLEIVETRLHRAVQIPEQSCELGGQ